MTQSRIFAHTAPKLWELGISAIPLKVRDKNPVVKGWDRFAFEMPTPELRDGWLNTFPTGNIGVVLGPQSDLMMVDIDTTDEQIIDAILSVLPESPYRRVGQKGMVLAYRYNGKSTSRIRGIAQHTKLENTIVEILSTRTQVVLPPSIHPDTQKPYVSNVDLADVYDNLPKLPEDAEQLIRGAIAPYVDFTSSIGTKKKIDVSRFISAGGRDNEMVRNAGFWAYAVMRGEKTLREAMDLMLAWVNNCVEHVDGDELSTEKALGKLIEFIQRDISKGKMLPEDWDDGLTPEEKTAWGMDVDEDQAQQPLDVFTKEIKDKFTKLSVEDSEKVHNLIKTYVVKISRRTNMDKLAEAQLLNLIHTASGKVVTKASLNSYLKSLKSEGADLDSHYDVAKQVVYEYELRNGKLAFEQNKLWNWKGTHWEEIDIHDIKTIVHSEYGSLDISKRNSDYKAIVEVVKETVQQGLCTIETPGVNFSNGFLTQDLELRPHQPEFGATSVLPFPYNPEASGRDFLFKDYLHSVWGHMDDFEERKSALQQLICVMLFGLATKFQRAVLLKGAGGSGKSVILEILTAMLPKSVQSSIPPHKWGERFMPVMMVGKLLNMAGEIPKDKKFPDDAFKFFVDGTPTTVEDKNQPAFEFCPKAMHWFCGNFYPVSADTTEGFLRRWVIFSFDRTIPESEKILDLGNKIVNEEIEAVVAWVLEAWPDLKVRQRYTLPASHYEEIKAMACENSTVRQWVVARIRPAKPASILDLNVAYSNYTSFCLSAREKGARLATFSQFKAELEEMAGPDKSMKVPFNYLRQNDYAYLDSCELIKDKFDA